MKKLRAALVLAVVIAVFFLWSLRHKDRYCLTGAFLADRPSLVDIEAFERNFGKKPYFVLVFVDWENFLDQKISDEIYSKGSVLCLTWEPFYAQRNKGIDYQELLGGRWDNYIRKFAAQVRRIDGDVFLRFAHEANGNWYPWSGSRIGIDTYKDVYRHIKKIFDQEEVFNVKWVFAINSEDVPQEGNHFMLYYPGDKYVDYIGIDGYNWGTTQKWSRWRSFRQIFEEAYQELARKTKKPIIISEFSSTSKGGDKSRWAREALEAVKGMPRIKAFILFNVNKETDWSFSGSAPWAGVLKDQLEDDYFKEALPIRR